MPGSSSGMTIFEFSGPLSASLAPSIPQLTDSADRVGALRLALVDDPVEDRAEIGTIAVPREIVGAPARVLAERGGRGRIGAQLGNALRQGVGIADRHDVALDPVAHHRARIARRD